MRTAWIQRCAESLRWRLHGAVTWRLHDGHMTGPHATTSLSDRPMHTVYTELMAACGRVETTPSTLAGTVLALTHAHAAWRRIFTAKSHEQGWRLHGGYMTGMEVEGGN